MLQFFRSNQLFASLLLIFYGFLLHLPGWWYPQEITSGLDSDSGVWGALVVGFIKKQNWLNISVPVVLLFVSSIFANRLAFRERLSRTVTQFPGLFIIFIGSLFPAISGAHSMQFANLFLLLAIIASFRLYQSHDTAKLLFNAGFWLGIATLFNANYAFFFFLIVLVGGTLNTLSLRLFFRVLAGVVTPIFLVGVYYFWNGKLDFFMEAQSLAFHLPTVVDERLWNIGGVVVISGVVGFTLFKQNNNTKLLNIQGRKKINLLYWWLFFSLLALPLFAAFDAAVVQLLVVPLGFLLSLSFSRGSESAGEAGHLFLLVLLFSLQLWPMFVQ